MPSPLHRPLDSSMKTVSYLPSHSPLLPVLEELASNLPKPAEDQLR
uniref:Uncharacterized protein n=1 Tax=Arundo donax TaxID=35708 RepID=A0A0A9GQ93_ARUDO